MESWQDSWDKSPLNFHRSLIKILPLSDPLGTPGRDVEERWSHERVLDVLLWWNFHRTFLSSYTILEPLGTSKSFMTPRRDMEQRWRLHSHRLIFCQILVGGEIIFIFNPKSSDFGTFYPSKVQFFSYYSANFYNFFQKKWKFGQLKPKSRGKLFHPK